MPHELLPLVSLGMSVYNCEKTVAAALRSILLQTFRSWEILLVDDGSTDDTVAVARSIPDPRIRVLADGLHKGIPYRRNQTVEMSRGRYFALIDGDDVAYPERFERQVSYLGEHPETDLLGSGILVFKGDGLVLGTRRVCLSHREICARPWAGFYLPQPTWMGRSEWFRAHPYRMGLARSEDQGLLIRTYRTSQFASLAEILVGYREESVSLRKSFVGRCCFCKSLIRESFTQREPLLAARGVAGQFLKGGIDVLAVGTGLGYRILRHRACPVDASIRSRWAAVWASVRRENIPSRAAPLAECVS